MKALITYFFEIEIKKNFLALKISFNQFKKNLHKQKIDFSVFIINHEFKKNLLLTKNIMIIKIYNKSF